MLKLEDLLKEDKMNVFKTMTENGVTLSGDNMLIKEDVVHYFKKQGIRYLGDVDIQHIVNKYGYHVYLYSSVFEQNKKSYVMYAYTCKNPKTNVMDVGYDVITLRKQHEPKSMFIRICKLTQNAKIPQYGSNGSAGADLYADIKDPVTIHPGETKVIGTGVALEFPQGIAALIMARSGLSVKQGLAPANKIGLCDSDYRGEYKVALYNHSKELQTISPGDRIAQVMFVPYYAAKFVQTTDLTDTKRGSGGFGSTGK